MADDQVTAVNVVVDQQITTGALRVSATDVIVDCQVTTANLRVMGLYVIVDTRKSGRKYGPAVQ